MDNLLLNLQQPLELLIYSTIIMLIIVSVFLVKLLVDLSGLVRSTQNVLGIIKHELEPTIREFKRALISINSIASSADNQVNNLNKSLNMGMNILSSSNNLLKNRVKIMASSIKQGILTGIKVFTEK